MPIDVFILSLYCYCVAMFDKVRLLTQVKVLIEEINKKRW